MNFEKVLNNILESDLIIVGDYYFINFEYDSVLDWLWLKDGHCVTEKKNKLRLKFDKISLDSARISGNVVEMFDVKGRLYKLELMDLTNRNL